MRRIQKDYARFLAALKRAADRAGEPMTFDTRSEKVSGWSVGQHLEHLLLADRRIVEGLASVATGRDPLPRPESGGGPSWRGWIILLTGFIPRGRGRTPESAAPMGMDRQQVAVGFEQVVRNARRLEENLEAIDRSPARMPHPLLGAFTAAQWLRFAGIHHAHHERIIRDILREAEPNARSSPPRSSPS